MRRLIVSLDALAALRAHAQVDLLAATSLAGLVGVDAVRVSVNEELRPITESDLRDLRSVARGLELRMAPISGLVKAAFETRPERVVLASEGRDGSHSARPLDFRAWGSSLSPVVRSLQEAGLEVVLLVGSDLDSIKAAHAADVRRIELFTGALVDLPETEQAEELVRLTDASRLAAKLRMRVGVGGALGMDNVTRVLESAPVAEWVSVGREWVGRSTLLGVDRATRDLQARLG